MSRTILKPNQGGTGVDNAPYTLTLVGSLSTSGGNTVVFTTTGASNVTIPTSGTLATLAGTETLTNKTLSGVSSLTSTGAITSSSASAGIGYTTGATVTQATSKTTGVTISAMCGTIVTSNSALNSGEYVVFTVTNTSVGATDFVDVKLKSGAANDGSYSIERVATSSGSFKVKIWNTYGDATSLSEALTLDFIVFKSAVS